jgi:transcriptional regulator with XRE-family HTH domain
MRYLTKKEKLSKFLIRERNRRGLSQQEVASAVDASLRNYQRWESGETFPQLYFWEKLQGLFGESINEAMMPDIIEHASQDRSLASGVEPHYPVTEHKTPFRRRTLARLVVTGSDTGRFRGRPGGLGSTQRGGATW